MNIHEKRELQNIATNCSFVDLQNCISEPYTSLTIDATLPANNYLRFRKNLLDPL